MAVVAPSYKLNVLFFNFLSFSTVQPFYSYAYATVVGSHAAQAWCCSKIVTFRSASCVWRQIRACEPLIFTGPALKHKPNASRY
jgi:hypothetical protein